MKFIKTDSRHCFNSDQILGFVIYQGCGSDNAPYYTVNAIPINADYRDQAATIEEFDRLTDAEDFLAKLVAKLNAEAHHVED
ncbi:MAG: hypothetical protein IJ774_05850 [Selenomonadaceae bacterium]|nr:hypothetical protein [Selenomonadaceae bacterium]MBR1805899.1 hypothetical protein [Selenomonadaceae bacterium]